MKTLFHRLFLVIIIATVYNPGSFSQTRENQPHKNSGYIELLGSGFIMSFNYQRHFNFRDGSHFSARVGIGPAFDDKEDAFLPIGLTWNFGTSKHIFETGAGYTHRPDPEDIRWINLIAGYRYQHPRGLLFKVQATPMIPVNDHDDDLLPIIPWVGIAAGWSF